MDFPLYICKFKYELSLYVLFVIKLIGIEIKIVFRHKCVTLNYISEFHYHACDILHLN